MAKIVRFHQTGEPEVLRIEEREIGAPLAGEVRIRVRAIGLNRAEALFRRGAYLEAPTLPAGLGYEASGTIEAVGPDVKEFAPGDAVSVIPAFSMNRYTMYGEEAIVPVHALAHKSEALSWEQAASVWMQYLTAWGALVSIAHIGSADAVVVTAASSSVGIGAIQIANALGAVSIAVTRTKAKRAELKRAGAAHVIVSDDEDVAAEIRRITGGRGARLVFDPVAGPGVEALAGALAPHGVLVIYGSLSGAPTPFPLFAALGNNLTMRGYTLFEVIADPVAFAAGKKFVLAGLAAQTLVPLVAKTFPLEEIVAAHRYLESNQQIGKVVVTVAAP